MSVNNISSRARARVVVVLVRMFAKDRRSGISMILLISELEMAENRVGGNPRRTPLSSFGRFERHKKITRTTKRR